MTIGIGLKDLKRPAVKSLVVAAATTETAESRVNEETRLRKCPKEQPLKRKV